MLKRLLVAAVVLSSGATATAGLLGGSGSASRGAEARASAVVCRAAAALELDCQLRRYAALVRTSGVDAAFAELKQAYEREGFVRAGCHPIVHAIGHAAVARYGDDLAQAFARGDPFCSAGYFHGVTEQVIVDIGPRRFVAVADSLCAELGGHERHSIYHRNCAHGIGHGFMLALDGDLPGALDTCDALSDPWERRSCYGGVFMQNVMALSGSRYLRPDDPLYPCADLADRHRAMCYEKQAGYALFVRDGDAGTIFELCAEVDRGFHVSCNQGLGTSVAVHYLKQVFEERSRTALIVKACELGRHREARASCIAGAVRALINYDHDVVQAARLCTAAAPALRPGCRRTIRVKRAYPE